ncbi:MAG: alpha-L-fucosidase [Clostridia bacterium]|nr:alpha-L-fucosidase [Clostridia bacterium]
MIVKQTVKDFENLGFGMFVHFGAYSVLGKGEWAKHQLKIDDKDYQPLVEQFNPDVNWAAELVAAAKSAGCKYITLTTRHHDGYSLFDTCGLNDYDAPHYCGRDLVREFVDACNAQGIIPFFYHTLLDWHHPQYDADFPAYLKYLRDSVELLCTNYGKIGGLWFDGKWNKPNEDWEEDALYGMIRSHQPDAIIINNTGLSARGQAGHIELDSVTYERGMPTRLPDDAPKYLAGEMCEVLDGHWGYAAGDLNYKSPAQMIRTLAGCRRYGANLLLNVGPMGNGFVRPIDKAMLGLMGEWVELYDEAIRCPRPAYIEIDNKPDDFLLKLGKTYYLFCDHLPMNGDPNVALNDTTGRYLDAFKLPETIRSITWMDTNDAVAFEQDGEDVRVHTVSFTYGRDTVIRVAKIECE